MESKGRGAGGRKALHVLAFIGVTLLLLVIALAAALFIATKGPSESAREAVYDWAAERNLQGIAGVFLSSEEQAELADATDGNPPAGEEPDESAQPMIIISEEAPEAAEKPAESETPESEAPAETGGEGAA